MNHRIAIILVALNFALTAAEPPPPNGVMLGNRLTIKSELLGENRSLQIFTPGSYESQKSSYPTLPVLYLLDGPVNFVHAAGMIDYLANANRIPPMIVVAVGNTERERDFTPTKVVSGSGAATKSIGGGAPKFLEFLRDELIPYVDKNYRTAPFRILFGHSLSGLFTVNVLLERPETFQAYLAFSPSLWWDHQVMFKGSRPIGRAKQFLFLTVEGNGSEQRAVAELFSRALAERATQGFQWEFKVYPGEIHESLPHISLYDSLKFIFPDWDFLSDASKDRHISYEDLVRHYHGLSEKYGYAIVVPQGMIADLAARLDDQGNFDDSIHTWQRYVEAYPKARRAYAGLGLALAKKGDKESAIRNLRTALEIDPNWGVARKALEELLAEQKTP